MSRLVIYVPFNRSAQSDIKQILYGVESAAATPGEPVAAETSVGARAMDSVVLVYAGEERGQVRAAHGDVLVVNAHGGPDDDLDLGDNSGGQVAPAALMAALGRLGAGAADEVIFYCCYSSQPGHVARLWKADHAAQTVYGSPDACAAGHFFAGPGRRTPLKFRSAVWKDHAGLEQV